MYVLINTENGKFVAKPGGRYSYTKNLCRAQIFSSEESARANSCPGNEKPTAVSNLVR